ncbi:MAG: extracellular solute-binding protein [Eubacteriales bacterium]|nr:extracellular solute-binding protein [Eubacteriales bacterium]
MEKLKMLRRYGKRALALLTSSILLLSIPFLMIGCSQKQTGFIKNKALDTKENIVLVVAGSSASMPGIDLIAQGFHEVYPNCAVEYEYLQDYSNTLPKRIASEEDRIDLFVTGNILKDSPNREYAVDLLEHASEVPLTDTLPGLVNNYSFVDDNGTTHLYAVPLGGEMRGLYVNKTLLSTLGLKVPQTRSELLAACQALLSAGYIPLEDNPSTFGHRLLFPYIANLAGRSLDVVAACDENAAEVFREPLQFLYDLTSAGYYNYKVVETETGRFIDISNEGMARSFLNITGSDGNYTKKDDIGEVAFMPASDSIMNVIEKVKEDYHSTIEYEFIIAPVTEDGGYAYISPNSGLAVSQHSLHTDWAFEFMRFFFTAENNKIYANAAHITPNTTDASEIINQKYSIPTENIGNPDNVNIGSYNLYGLIVPSLVTTCKGNNPKYCQADGSMYPFETYMDELKAAFAEQRATIEGTAK